MYIKWVVYYLNESIVVHWDVIVVHWDNIVVY